MSEVDQATTALRQAHEVEAESLKQLKVAQDAYRNCQDATRAAWVALREAQWRVGRDIDTNPSPLTFQPKATNKHARANYDFMDDIDRLTNKAKRREERA